MNDVINVIAFTLLAALWLAFAAALVVSRPSLDLAWQRVGALSVPAKGALWLLTLPVMLGLAVWEGARPTRTWPRALRLLIVAGLAFATLNVFLPRGIG